MWFLLLHRFPYFWPSFWCNMSRSTQTFDSNGTVLDGGSLAFHISQHVGRHSLVLSHPKRSHHGCFARPHAQSFVISAFNTLASQWCRNIVIWNSVNTGKWFLLVGIFMCVAQMGSLPQSVRQWHGWLECLWWSTSNVGRNGKVGVLENVSQSMPCLPLN